MKTWFGISKTWLSMGLFLGIFNSASLAGQTSVGILPVTISSEVQHFMDGTQSAALSAGLLDYLVAEFSKFAGVTKISREHVLLLLKDLPNATPECLDAESLKAISSKEKLHYLVQCSTGTIRVAGTNVIASLKIIIIDGINGKVFWDREISSPRPIIGNVLTESILLDEVYKPIVDELIIEIKTLKF